MTHRRRLICPIHFTSEPREDDLAVGLLSAMSQWAQRQGLKLVARAHNGVLDGYIARHQGSGMRTTDRKRIILWLQENVAGGEAVVGDLRLSATIPRPTPRPGILTTFAIETGLEADDLKTAAQAFVDECSTHGIEAIVSVTNEITTFAAAALRPDAGDTRWITVWACPAERGAAWDESARRRILDFGAFFGARKTLVQPLTDISAPTDMQANTSVIEHMPAV